MRAYTEVLEHRIKKNKTQNKARERKKWFFHIQIIKFIILIVINFRRKWKQNKQTKNKKKTWKSWTPSHWFSEWNERWQPEKRKQKKKQYAGHFICFHKYDIFVEFPQALRMSKSRKREKAREIVSQMGLQLERLTEESEHNVCGHQRFNENREQQAGYIDTHI